MISAAELELPSLVFIFLCKLFPLKLITFVNETRYLFGMVILDLNLEVSLLTDRIVNNLLGSSIMLL